MATLNINLYLNNTNVGLVTDPVRITNPFPVINWSFEPSRIFNIDEYSSEIISSVQGDQLGYEIRIANDNEDWGTNAFLGDRVSTEFIFTQERYWHYQGVPLDRGVTYYGQIAVEDELNRETGWIKFDFIFNALPIIKNLKINPSSPAVTDDLKLTYDYEDIDGDVEKNTIIRWFKNGVHQRQFNDSIVVESAFLELKDTWFADVLPGDGYENGIRITSPVVKITKVLVTASDIEILPVDANENSILTASYKTNNPLERDVPSIRWFINDKLANQFNDQKYIRPDVSSGDQVRFEIKTGNGVLFSSSPEKKILSSDFVVYDLVIDGQRQPLKVSSLGPTISWKVFSPKGKNSEYINIKIGTFFEADNVFSTTVQSTRTLFTVPPNILQRGRDYFVSVSVSDTQTFNKFTSEQFRIVGSRWQEKVDNSIGWTIETIFLIETVGDFDGALYQVVRIRDGTKFAEIRIYNEKIAFISDKITFSKKVDTTGTKILTVTGKKSDIKVYLNRKLIIDGTGLLIQETNDKKLEIGNATGEIFIVRYKFFLYTVSGAFNPGSSGEFNKMQFHTFLEFENTEIVSLKGFTRNFDDFKVFGVNPDNGNDSGSIYSIVPGKSFQASTVNRTFSPINKIRQSSDGKKVVFAHSKGVSIVSGYVINPFDEELIFVDDNGVVDTGLFPEDKGWQLVQNIKHVAGFFDDNGFNINTIENI